MLGKYCELSGKLLTACRILDREGVLDELGHFSVRLPDNPDCLLMNGKVSPGQAGEADLIILDREGRKLAGERDAPKEIPLHLRLYRKNPAVQAVLHTHSPAVLGVSVLGHCLRALENLGATVFGQQAPLFEEYGLVDNDAMGDRIADAMGDVQAIVLKGHGDIVVGESIEEACVFAVWAEKAARLQLQVLSAGEPHWMPEAEVAKVRRQVRDGRAVIRSWNYFNWKWENR